MWVDVSDIRGVTQDETKVCGMGSRSEAKGWTESVPDEGHQRGR